MYLTSHEDIWFSPVIRTRDGRIRYLITENPLGYQVCYSAGRVAIAYHPNLEDGEEIPKGPWNLPDGHMTEGGAFALQTWTPEANISKEEITTLIFEHWQKTNSEGENPPGILETLGGSYEKKD